VRRGFVGLIAVVTLVAPAVLALFPAEAFAQMIRDSTVPGSANKVTRIAPDRASMYALVQGSAETAVTRGEMKLKAVMEARKALGRRAAVDRPVTYSVGSANQPNVYPQRHGQLPSVSRRVMRAYVSRVD
jgi:hypothetical protein